VQFDAITRRRFARFQSMKRGWYSFIVLGVVSILALMGPLLVGSRPLVLKHDGSWRFPIFSTRIASSELGLQGDVEPNWRILQTKWQTEGSQNWIILPLIPFSANEVCEVNLPAQLNPEGRWSSPQGSITEGRIFRLNTDGTREMSWTVMDGKLHGDARKMRDSSQVARGKFEKGKLVDQIGEAADWTPSGTLYTYVPAPAPPGLDGHLLGTDESGHDIFARLFYGYRIILIAACIYIPVMYIIGLLLGAAMGYFGGWFDLVAQRAIEVWSNIPFLYAVILLSTLLEPSLALLMIILVAFSWIGLAHQMRAAAYSTASKDYVAASRTLGASHFRIIVRHILPNTITVAVTMLPFSIAGLIASLSALDYLGFGLPPTEPSWGELLRQGKENWMSWWIATPTVFCMVSTLVLVNFVGEAVRDAFDPRKTDT